MYSYEIYYKNSKGVGLSPRLKTIKALKARYADSLKWSTIVKYDDISEIVVMKGRKIHGYYDRDFKLDKSKPVFVHNMLYGLEQ
tara:strand:+ start:25917 stop:26168 length:252 start_codon:yes stop_codon:yes gene_type:complete